MKHFSFLVKKWPLFIIATSTGLVASFLEGLGIVVIFPIIEGVQNTGAESVFPFNLLSNLFTGWGLSQRLQVAAGLLIFITILKGSALYANIILSCRLQMVVLKHFRMRCFNQLMRVGMKYFNHQKKADLQTICNLHTINLGNLIKMITSALPNIFNVILLIIMLFILSWKMTLVSLVLVSFASFVLRILSRKSDSVGRLYNNSLKSLNSVVFNVLTGMKTIRIFNRQGQAVDNLEKEVDHFNKNLLKMVTIRGSAKPVFETVTVICLALMLIAGSFFLVSSSQANLPKLLVFLVILYRIVNPVMSLNQLRIYIGLDIPSYREVFKFLESQDKQCLPNGRKTFSGLKKGIEFRNLKFAYNSDKAMVFEDLSLSIAKGTKVGVVGASGIGKSTLIEVLMRFYDPQAGGILIDGVNLKELDVYSWRRHIGVVSQDAFLFNDSLRSNITFAKPQSTQEELDQACRRAHADQFIMELPNKYDTLIGDRGVLLSGGQRQRIAIARAVIADPEILIFDEATSSLDSESERIVQEALDEVGRDKTVITIAHRLSTIANSDIIFVINEGRIIEQGSHQRLLENNGIYKKLVQKQKLGFDSDLSQLNVAG